MFWNLTIREMKLQLKNVTFFLLIGIIILFYATQFAPEIGSEPQPGQSFYGVTKVQSDTEEISAVYEKMKMEYSTGQILKQGFIINKVVKLKPAQMDYMKRAMESIAEEGASGNSSITPKVSYEEYLITVRALDKKLGGSTYYSDKLREYLCRRQMTYEEAKQEYADILIKDKLTNAYGRLFGDYAGITAGFFPIFIAAFVLTRDKRSNMQELVYSRKVSSVIYVASKYTALCLLLWSVYLLLALHPTIAFYRIGVLNNYTIDLLAFFKYTVFWIFPTVMFTVSIGMLLSILLENGIAGIILQFILWMSSMLPLAGSYGLTKPVIRFNMAGAYESYIKWLPSIIANRVFYTLFSIALIGLTAWIWDRKRGDINGGFTLFSFAALQRKANA